MRLRTQVLALPDRTRVEPGIDWEYEQTDLRLYYDDDAINVVQVVPDGERAICSVPLDGIFLVLLAAMTGRHTPSIASSSGGAGEGEQ